MALPPVVLVVTAQFDPTADSVVQELNRRGRPVFRCDVAEFPLQLTMSARLDGCHLGVLRTTHREVHLEEIGSVYYRRPTEFVFPERMLEVERRWAFIEARLGFGGLLAGLPSWLNHPVNAAFARYKPVWLRSAGDCGLNVPRTLLTNDPDQARLFAEQVGTMVYKPLSAGGVVDDDTYRTIFTTVVAERDWGDQGVCLTAHLFQEWVEHEHAVRLTVVDDRLFAAAIHAHSGRSRVDWRADYDALTYAPTEVPESTRRCVLSLMRTLGLRFAALDFLVTSAGNWVFLDLNANGQWAWIEDETGLPITAAIADALMDGPLS